MLNELDTLERRSEGVLRKLLSAVAGAIVYVLCVWWLVTSILFGRLK